MKYCESKVVTLIPARAGSKGIKNKNLVELGGIPLLSYSCRASRASDSIETWVSTNCDDISRLAKKEGCKVLRRPENLCTDQSKSDDALVHFSENVDFDILVFLQATSPFISSDDINKGIEMVHSKKFDSVFAVSKEDWAPRWTSSVKPLNWDINNRPMRQDVDSVYVESGGLYVTTNLQLKSSKLRYGGKMGFIKIPLVRNIDINSPDDIELAKAVIISQEFFSF